MVVLATGHDHTPIVPDWPGREGFSVTLTHLADFRTAEPFAGQEVLVRGLA